MFKGGGQKLCAYFIGSGRPVEFEEGGNISVTLGHLMIICILKNLLIFFDFFCNQFNFKMLTFKKYTLKS